MDVANPRGARPHMASASSSSAAADGEYIDPDAPDDEDLGRSYVQRPDYRQLSIRVGLEEYMIVYLLVIDKESGWFGKAALNELLTLLREELMQRLPGVMNQREPKLVLSQIRGDTLSARLQYLPRVGKVWMLPGQPDMVDREYPGYTDSTPKASGADGPTPKRPKATVGQQPRWKDSYASLPYSLIINAERVRAARAAPG